MRCAGHVAGEREEMHIVLIGRAERKRSPERAWKG
jgi:hypothetical protein